MPNSPKCIVKRLYHNGSISEHERDKLLKALEQEPKTDVLDKIKTEIEEEYGNCDICEWYEDYDYEENDISEFQRVGSVSDILEIIDKYKAESEDKK